MTQKFWMYAYQKHVFNYSRIQSILTLAICFTINSIVKHIQGIIDTEVLCTLENN